MSFSKRELLQILMTLTDEYNYLLSIILLRFNTMLQCFNMIANGCNQTFQFGRFFLLKSELLIDRKIIINGAGKPTDNIFTIAGKFKLSVVQCKEIKNIIKIILYLINWRCNEKS